MGKLIYGFIHVSSLKKIKEQCVVHGLEFDVDQPDVFFHNSDCAFIPYGNLKVTFTVEQHASGIMLQAKDVRLQSWSQVHD